MRTNNSDYQDYVINVIKSLRIANNISQVQLSDILQISTGQIGNIESPKFPHKYTLKQIQGFCKYINYPIERIFLSEEDDSSENKIELLINKIIEYYD